MEPWVYDAVSGRSNADVSDSGSWGYILWSFILFTALIYLMCHTADNYFSPVLAAMCDLLDMPPEVAGVTFLAFGNGAPDVFSAFVALSSSINKEDGLLVGVGSLLGSTITTVTLIIGCVVYIKPAEVPAAPFTRDLVFLVLALGLVLVSTSMGRVPVWLASCYLALYGAYVAMVFKGPTGRVKREGNPAVSPASSQAGLEVGVLGPGPDDEAMAARWVRNGGGGGGGGGGAGRVRDGNGVGTGLGVVDGSGEAPPSAGLSGGGGGGGAGVGGDFSAGGICVRHDYFGGDQEGDEEERSLLGGGGGGGHGGRNSGVGRSRGDVMGGELSDSRSAEHDGEAFSMVPGSTMSMLSEEDDSAATWLAQRRWGGGSGVWGRPRAKNGVGGETREPLLKGKGSPIDAQNDARIGPSADYSRESSFAGRRFEHAWETLQWKQWRLRRRVRREVGNSDVLRLPPYRRVLWALELPIILIRNATIPPVEVDSWSQTQAAISTALAPALMVWAFGLWNVSVIGVFTWGWLAFLGGLPTGVAVWFTTHKRRMPEDRWYRLALVFVSFFACVSWIYYFADLTVTTIDNIGTVTGIPSSVLGLTLLAWGNSSGDLVTNLAVAKAGFPGMAIAGSYGGPLFNVLLGIGLPMIYSSVRFYPTASVFELDTSTVFTTCMTMLVLVGTLPTVALSGFRFPTKAPLALLGVYAVYLGGAMYFTFTFSGAAGS